MSESVEELKSEITSLKVSVAYLTGAVETLMTVQGEAWQKTESAAKNLKVHPSTLKRWAKAPLKSPYFAKNKHFRRKGSEYEFNIAECRRAISNHNQY